MAGVAKADEQQLWDQYQSDPTDRAVYLLIVHYQPLVWWFVRKWFSVRRLRQEREDAYQYAMECLVKALPRYDATKGASVGSYVRWTVSGACLRYIRNRLLLMRIPRTLRCHARQYRQQVAHLQLFLSPKQVQKHIADTTGWSSNYIRTLRALDRLGQVVVCVDQLEARIVSEHDSAATAVGRVLVDDLVGRLMPTLRRIILLRYFAGWSQAEVANVLGCTQQHISRLERRALAIMKDVLRTAD